MTPTFGQVASIPYAALVMQVSCPDGNKVLIGAGCVLGRRNLGAGADDSISREQFRLDPVEGITDVAHLQVLGKNGNAYSVIKHATTVLLSRFVSAAVACSDGRGDGAACLVQLSSRSRASYLIGVFLSASDDQTG